MLTECINMSYNLTLKVSPVRISYQLMEVDENHRSSDRNRQLLTPAELFKYPSEINTWSMWMTDRLIGSGRETKGFVSKVVFC